jgi:molecular chaperone DnaK (HSP70)
MIIGIDLGTNNIVLSYFDSRSNNKLNIIGKPIPSVVSLIDNNIIIGEEAKKYPECHYNLKRRLSNNPKLISIYTSLLIKIKEIIDDFTKNEEYNVIVTVPAYFSESDKEVTKRAILGAGLPLLRLLSEPTAAGIAYGYFHYTTEEVILVFDMGAGTTDLTLMRKSSEDKDNFYEVLSIMGDVKFGGEDITQVLEREYNIKDAENKKILLSDGDINEMTQKKYFDILDIKYTENINKLFDKILNDGNINKKSVDQIILVGGSTKNPFIRKTVENYFQKDLKFLIDPDTAVSFGATIFGNSLISNTNNVVLVDRLALSIGLEVDDGKYAKLIEKGSIIPTKRESFFTTQEDNQEYILINIYQGEHHYVKDNYLCGSFKIMIEPRPKCTPKINVVAEVTPDGILVVSAKEGKNEDSLKIHTTRNNNIEKYGTILPYELYEEEFEMLYGMYCGMKQQILFQLTENIYLKMDKELRMKRLEFFNENDSIVETFTVNFNRLFGNDINIINDIRKMEENIIEMKEIIQRLKNNFSDYLTNYELENTKTDWKKKLESLVDNLDKFKLSEEKEEKIINIIETIITLDNINCNDYFTEIDEILGFNF